jgi:2-methylaconitate cis-trans-isomerase PrpF
VRRFNVIDESKGQVEVSAVDPAASMQAVERDALGEIATEIRDKLQK